MQVAIAGGHGKIAMRLTRRLCSRGDSVIGLVRNPDHAADIREAGGEPALCDLEQASERDVTAAIRGADAVIFAAGAGPGSGAARKLTMDRDGAVKLLRAAEAAGASRYLMISATGAASPPPGDEPFSVYLRAKAEADEALMASDREWTILRPGRLTDDPGTGRVRISTEPFRGEIPRDDVAAVLEAVLGDGGAIRQILYVNGGEDPLEEALGSASG